MALENEVRRLLHEISEDLCQAIGESPVVGAKLAELHEAGYSLNLVLDCRQNEEVEGQAFSLDQEARLEASSDELDASDSAAGTNPAQPATPAQFRINAKDLAFLRSVGIDPTRRARSKSSRTHTDEAPSSLE